MSYSQAMRHRPHRLTLGHTFNPSGLNYTAPREPEPRERCPGCGRKYARSTVCWLTIDGQGPAMCKRCSTRRAGKAGAS